MKDLQTRRHGRAQVRLEIVTAYLVVDPPPGHRERLRRELAARIWTDPDGRPFTVAAVTIRKWVRRYQRQGLAGLMDQPRPAAPERGLRRWERAALQCPLVVTEDSPRLLLQKYAAQQCPQVVFTDNSPRMGRGRIERFFLRTRQLVLRELEQTAPGAESLAALAELLQVWADAYNRSARSGGTADG